MALNRWYTEAGEQGDANAQHQLGLMFANGIGHARDDAQAMKWYRWQGSQIFCSPQNMILNPLLFFHFSLQFFLLEGGMAVDESITFSNVFPAECVIGFPS